MTDGKRIQPLIPIAAGEGSIALPRRFVKAGMFTWGRFFCICPHVNKDGDEGHTASQGNGYQLGFLVLKKLYLLIPWPYWWYNRYKDMLGRCFMHESVNIADYDPDPQITELLEPWHLRARADAETVIGRLEGGPLAPESAEDGAPAALVQDTALIDLINAAQLHYTGAAVSAAALNTLKANLYPGEIHKCDVSLIYRYTNTLYVLRMTGVQLKRYMEWSANFYNQYRPGEIYADGDTPELVASEVRSDIGGIRELIRDYIVNVKNGVITPECNDNWRITW